PRPRAHDRGSGPGLAVLHRRRCEGPSGLVRALSFTRPLIPGLHLYSPSCPATASGVPHWRMAQLADRPKSPYPAAMPQPSEPPAIECVGSNSVRLWGLTMQERARRIGSAAGLQGGGPAVVLTNADFAFDPSWIAYIAEHPGRVLTLGGIPAIAHARHPEEADRLRAAMADRLALAEGEGLRLESIAYEDGPTIENKTLRKRETPFLMRLLPETRAAVE